VQEYVPPTLRSTTQYQVTHSCRTLFTEFLLFLEFFVQFPLGCILQDEVHPTTIIEITVQPEAKLESALEQNETQISELQDELSQKDHQIRILEQSVQNLQLQCPWPPFQFTLENFSQHKRNKDVQYCPGFHTYPGGHKLCIAVYSNGHGEGTNTHMSLWLYCMRTSLDSQLKWPVKCTLKIELLNQEGDYQHHKTTISASWGKPITDRFGVRPIESKFITHSALEYDPTNSTQYLRDDCLHFRVNLM